MLFKSGLAQFGLAVKGIILRPVDVMLPNLLGSLNLCFQRVHFFIALLKAAALQVKVVFGFLKQHSMPIHFIPSQIHAFDHENHNHFALECHLEGEI